MPEITTRLRPPRYSTAGRPASPLTGEMYYDTTTNVLMFWDGTAWVSTKSAAGTIYDSDYVGTIKAYAGSPIPTNWMLCDGRTLDNTLYPDLFAAIGYKYGGSGINFQLPDLRSKFIYGVAQTDLSDLGVAGGASSVTLDLTQIPAHTHAGSAVVAAGNFGGTAASAGDHFHTPTSPTDAFMLNTGGQQISFATGGNVDERCVSLDGQTNTTGAHTHTVNLNSHGHGLTIVSEGGGVAHENLPPYIRMIHMIKVTGAQINAGGALQGATGAKGDPGPWRGAWSAATAYSVGDSVSYYDGTVTGSYRRKVAGTTAGNPKTDTTNWELIASGGSVGANGAPGTVPVYEQAGTPSDTTVGAIWIDTDDVAPIYMGSPLVTSLPSNPVDGQEVHYLADAANGVIWHLRYRAASTSAYKWEFLGGSPLIHQIDTDEGGTTTAYADFATVGPQLTTPLAGDYVAEYGALSYQTVASVDNYYTPKLGGAATNDVDTALATFTGTSKLVVHQRKRRFNALAASTLVKMQFKMSSANAGSFRNRWLTITPVRVG
jgi:microcystin-dependent protein